MKYLAAALLLLAAPAYAEDDMSLPAPAPEQKFEGRASVEKYFQEKGLAPHVAAGIADNVARESNFDPTAKGDGGSSGGLFQEHNERYRTLLANIEMDTAWHELMGKDKQAAAAFNKLKNAKTEQEARDIFAQSFERCAKCGAGDPSAKHHAAAQRASRLVMVTNHPIPGPPGAPPGVTAPTGSGAWWQQMLAAHGHGGGSPYIASAATPTTAATTYTTPARVPSTTVSSLPQTMLALAAFLRHRR